MKVEQLLDLGFEVFFDERTNACFLEYATSSGKDFLRTETLVLPKNVKDFDDVAKHIENNLDLNLEVWLSRYEDVESFSDNSIKYLIEAADEL